MPSLTVMTEVSELSDFMLGEIGIQVGAFNMIPAIAIIAFHQQCVTERILQYCEITFAYWLPHQSWTNVEKVIKKET